jgi:hypothetical protein
LLVKRWLVLGGVALGLLLIAGAGASLVACRFVTSYDTCRQLPQCSATLTDGTDGPGWHCDPFFDD